ncbi:amidohydrolase family protein [Nocardia sp. NPDC049190]|uniref:amidohydrolase family protein n=1 Tax=Nocardia sp. NPDC049190 TaxID=3155650 RepID=UPI0033DEDCD3
MLDVHCHFVPGPTIATLDSFPTVRLGDGAISHAGRTLPLPARLGDADGFAAHIAGLDLAVVSPPPGLYLESLAEERPGYAEQVNDDILAWAPDGVGVLGWLPLWSPAAALAAIERLAGHPKAVGLTMGTTHGAALVDSSYDQVWHALAEAGLALQLHPDSDPYRPDAKGLANASVLGFPSATTAAVVRLLLDGDGFWASGARLCLVHGGGFLALTLPRLLRGVPGKRDVVVERMTRLFADALVFDEPATRLVEATFAPEHVLPGSDWPFPVGLPQLPERDDWRAALAGWSPRAAALLPLTTTRKDRQDG